MAGQDQGAGTWLRYGCLGCAGVLALMLGGISVLISLGRGAADSQRITRESVEEPLPAFVPSPENEAGFSDAPRLVLPDFSDDGAYQPPAGRVLLDLRHGEFHIEPALPGEPLRIEAEYDENRYKLVTELDESDDGEWSYEVRFRQTGTTSLVSMLAQMMGADNPRVTVYLPRDVPMNLDLRFSQGGGEVDLGGLWLTEASVAFMQGGGDLQFSEPLRRPLESMRIDASMGGGAFRRLGHASPRTLEVTTQMGGGEVDLRGEWRQDSEISLRSSMGGLEVRLPDRVLTRGLPRDRSQSVEAEGDSALPILTFSYSHSMGGIEFRN